jgi:hypothetical protein
MPKCTAKIPAKHRQQGNGDGKAGESAEGDTEISINEGLHVWGG